MLFMVKFVRFHELGLAIKKSLQFFNLINHLKYQTETEKRRFVKHYSL